MVCRARNGSAIWRDICATNDDEIGKALDALIAVLRQLRGGLTDPGTIDAIFESAAAWRAKLPKA